ncbi:Asparagine--tRNA ligase [Acholeplasma oculi]|uniref:Asparagine--tRNA ligase n=1 Tax=Acholeplasma oculi TaxID=35623 RepID=A0A061AKI1_9MOLU|nr:asparagine--tRNA ligase [Acholeplasma oculi]CDR31537.1 Asparagine--tRNA ligase [Acholeplasma oculi]SKC49822.1 asparaginyl-tRNA synthetase [Acholeplasma oculi]SUT92396.1 Asparagine--tRNA ligase [Acholeplasma oculi]
MQLTIRKIYEDPKLYKDQEIILQGWIRNHRDQKDFGFINLNDGTFFETIQVVYERENTDDFEAITKLTVGSSIEVVGRLELTPERSQPFEIKAKKVTLIGGADETYPIQPKRHTREFLREVAHLRPRTNLFSAVFRVRSIAAYAIHKFFQEQHFVYVHTPIITANDGEGAGEMFKVTTLNMDKLPRKEDGTIDYSKDFFGKEANLTVTGQLEGEAYAMAFRNIYTFGPTFRAENSNTMTHASEFWMIEPEIAFADIFDNMALIEDMVKYVVAYVLKEAKEEMEFFDKFVEKGLLQKLNDLLHSKFNRVTHEDAINILLNANVKFENKPAQGRDLAKEHEKFLTEKHFKSPVFVTDWPKDIKAFYMRLNDDGKTVAAVDLLVPGSGELVGGSQREERIDLLLKRMEEMHVPLHDLDWYVDLRRYGGAKHAGFGLGFERFLIYLTGVENIRDVIPFPRTPKNILF